ncbi:pilus assembly protein TadG-related protein [Novosphingobium sp.]|uniref:pilus assembly protein TadG-related protein n=1 Tax=Novosphingobium sp. TaxID=1874826 RepID=UPI0025E5C323|nr:pilus assembly protein TadG-related protein [Novosphingobium sp.]
MIALIAAALFPLLALVGSSIDMGRLYVVQSRLQQAYDAGTLAARKQVAGMANFNATSGDDQLTAINRGRMLFKSNFPDGMYGARNLAFNVTVNPDLSIKGTASLIEPTTLMAIFGLTSVPMAITCTAQMTVTNTDIMMVLDVTGSMNETLSGDSQSKISAVRKVVKDFWSQTATNQVPGTRIRFGFVPYSTNVNVGGVLKDEWVVPNWTYQSRTLTNTSDANGTYSFYTAISPVSGTSSSNVDQSYPASFDLFTLKFKCKNPLPPSTGTPSIAQTGSETKPFAGPPAGTSTVLTYQRTRNGADYSVAMQGLTCIVTKTTYLNYVDTWQYITNPAQKSNVKWSYQPVTLSTAGWRTDSNGCMEERATYEIDDYANVDLGRALDLVLDRVPDASNPATQWRPQYPDLIYERQLDWSGGGSFDTGVKVTNDEYIAPGEAGFAACPPPSKKLQVWEAADLDGYLTNLVAAGSTYHDIGMIWGGRLISPTGLFASENADASPSNTTKRNVIMLTDGQTAPLDISYGTYGVEPLDQRRWTPNSPISLTQVVEKRFTYACNAIKNKNITVWFIAFGTTLNPIMTDCAGPGHSFSAANSTELAAAFAQISKGVSNLRISG